MHFSIAPGFSLSREQIIMDDTLAYYGGAVKALGGGKVGGYLVLFSGPDDPDLQGDYFTKSTDFKLRNGRELDILYRHGVHPVLKSRTLGSARVTIDDVGLFLEGELELRDNYEKAVYKLAEMGKLGWSSGAMGHLVNRTSKKKAFEVDVWGIGEASLTPNPVEARTSAFPLKDMGDEVIDLDDFVKSLEHPFDVAGVPAIAKFCEDVSPNSLKDGSERSESAASAAKEFITITNILGEAYHSYKSRLVRRTENRFLKDNREMDALTVVQVESLLADMKKVVPAFESVKEALEGLHKISEMGKAEQKAMSEKAKFALWNYYRISGYKPEELEHAGTSTS
jgi:phage head maturation protease